MQTHKERMVVVWNEDGSFRGASLDERFEYEDGSTRNEQRPLSEADADALVGAIDTATAVQLDAAKETIDAQAETIETLNAKIKELQTFDPRYIRPDAWYGRMTLENVSALLELIESGDPVAKQFFAAFQAVKESGRLMWLDHADAQQGVGYLQSKAVFSAEESAAMFADATEAEA